MSDAFFGPKPWDNVDPAVLRAEMRKRKMEEELRDEREREAYWRRVSYVDMIAAARRTVPLPFKLLRTWRTTWD